MAGRLPVASATHITNTVMRFAYDSGVEACSEAMCSGCVLCRTLCVSERGVARRDRATSQAQESNFNEHKCLTFKIPLLK
jgi:hypothetical protein